MKTLGTQAKRKILLVSAYADYPMRSTSSDHLYSFRRYADDNVYYLNLALKSVPRYVLQVDFDLIVFHTFFLTNHWRGPTHFRKLFNRAAILKNSRAVKVILPQDEFIHSDLLSEFINEFQIDIVFSVAPPSTLSKIYRTFDFNRVQFFNVLTGYFDEGRLNAIVAPKASVADRPIDIGYRTSGKPFYWFGRHGFLKQDIADIFQRHAPPMGFLTDISTSQEDTIKGDEWYRFLSQCKYAVGSESGTSMIDPDGSIRERTDRYVLQHPHADMKEVEAACFPGVDGSTLLFAMSPRNLECCATRTCQVLTEGDYNGILKPNVHYIELKKDFSNIHEVLKDMLDDQRRSEIVERAFADIVESGQYTYRIFVRYVIEQSLEGRATRTSSTCQRILERIIYGRMYLIEKLEQFWIRLLSPVKPFIVRLLRP